MNLIKVVAAGGVCTLIAGTSLYKFRQYQFRSTTWYQEACMKVAKHRGVSVLVGPPPLKMGEVERFTANEFVPSTKVDPEPLYVLKIPIEGQKGKANILLWMNYLSSIEEARKSVNAWNVGLIEVQIGKDQNNKFCVE